MATRAPLSSPWLCSQAPSAALGGPARRSSSAFHAHREGLGRVRMASSSRCAAEAVLSGCTSCGTPAGVVLEPDLVHAFFTSQVEGKGAPILCAALRKDYRASPRVASVASRGRQGRRRTNLHQRGLALVHGGRNRSTAPRLRAIWPRCRNPFQKMLQAPRPACLGEFAHHACSIMRRPGMRVKRVRSCPASSLASCSFALGALAYAAPGGHIARRRLGGGRCTQTCPMAWSSRSVCVQ